MIYYVIFGVLFLLSLIFDILPFRLSKRLEFVIFWSVSLWLLLFAGLRTTGLQDDFDGYKSIFSSIASLRSLRDYAGYSIEYGYMFLNRLCGPLGFGGFIFVLAFISVGLKLVYIYARSSRKFIAMFYYYCIVFLQSDMGLLRHSMATGICLYALDFLSEGRKGRFILTVIAASLFHSAALSVLVMLIPGSKCYRLRDYLGVLLAAFLLSYVHVMASMLSFLSPLAGNTIAVIKLTFYLSRTNNILSLRIFISLFRRIFLWGVFSFFIHLLHKTPERKISDINRLHVYYNAYFLYVLIPVLFSDMLGVAMHRGSMIFRPAEIFLFSYSPETIAEIKCRSEWQLIYRFILGGLILISGYYAMIGVIYQYPGYIPYTWNI